MSLPSPPSPSSSLPLPRLRKLTRPPSSSLTRLRSLYTNQKYFMVTSTYQTVVLLQFNSSGDSLSYADLSVGTGINDDMLKGVLGLLCKQRVIDLKDGMYELNLGELSFLLRCGAGGERGLTLVSATL